MAQAAHMKLHSSRSGVGSPEVSSSESEEDDQANLGTLHASHTKMLALRLARRVRSHRRHRQEVKALKAALKNCSIELPSIDVQINSGLQRITMRHRVLQARIAALQAEHSELEEIRNGQSAEQHWIDSSFQQAAKQRDEADDRSSWLMDRLVQLLELRSPDKVHEHLGDVLSHLEKGQCCRSEQLQCLRGQLEVARSENCQKAIKLTNELYRSKQLRSDAHKLLGELLTSGGFSCIADSYGQAGHQDLTNPQSLSAPLPMSDCVLSAEETQVEALQTTVNRVEEQIEQLLAVHQSLCSFEEKQGQTHQSSLIANSEETPHHALDAPAVLQPAPDAGAGPDVRRPSARDPDVPVARDDESRNLLPLELRMREVLEAAEFSDVVIRLEDGRYQFGKSVKAHIRIANGNQVVASTDGTADEPFEALVSRMTVHEDGQPGATVEQLVTRPTRIAVRSPITSTRTPSCLQVGGRHTVPCHRNLQAKSCARNRQGSPATGSRTPPATGSSTPRVSANVSGTSRALSRSCSPSNVRSPVATGTARSVRHALVPAGDAAAGLDRLTNSTLDGTLANAGSPHVPPAVPTATQSRTPDRHRCSAIADGHSTIFARQRAAATSVATPQRTLVQQRSSSVRSTRGSIRGAAQQPLRKPIPSCSTQQAACCLPRRQVSSRVQGIPVQSNPNTPSVPTHRRTPSLSPSRKISQTPVAGQNGRPMAPVSSQRLSCRRP